jgi:hypothetical protein
MAVVLRGDEYHEVRRRWRCEEGVAPVVTEADLLT